MNAINEWWAIPMLISGGLFAGTVALIAWERLPIWRNEEPSEFRTTFAQTLRRVDLVQPALAVVALVSAAGTAVDAGGGARTAAAAAAIVFLTILVVSGAWLVPVQRRIVRGETADVPGLRAAWIRGHQIRTAAALTAFTLAVVATTW